MIRSSRASVALLTALLLGGGALTALAGATRSMRQTTAKDFEEGEATASMIVPTGEVVPGMKTSRVPVDAAFAWCAVLARDGRTAYFGTGDQGRVFAVPVARPSGAEAAARKLAEIDAAWITSLALKPDGTLLAGSTPGGKVFAVNVQNGAVRLLAKIPAEHVWALVHDAKSGVTYAAAGGPGKIFAIDAKGTVKPHWDSADKHIVSLADGGDGSLLAGTSEEGILYRVRGENRAEALHDFEADEVRAILRSGPATYLAVNDFDRGSGGGGGDLGGGGGAGPQPARGTRISATSGGAPAAVGGPVRPGQVKSRAAVYRLEPDGQIEQVFASTDGYFTGLLLGDGGDVYVAAGTQGKLYRLAADRSVALAADLPERQALSLGRTSDGFLVGTGDIGGVYRVRPAAPGEASYLSKVFDAEVPARWGHLRWSGTPGLTFETRSGNTAKPDKSWSEWRKLDGSTHASAEGEGRVASNGSRYLQYRVALPNKSTVLRETTIFYLPQNQRARITDVYLDGRGSGGSSSSSSSTSSGGEGGGGGASTVAGSSRVHSSVLKIRWRVDNPDGDDLIYRLSFRQEGEAVWRPLGGPEPLTRAEHDWNTESVPDGRYVVRVWTSDERVTPRERALDSSFESPPFLVDNSKPEVTGLQARAPTVTGRVKDDASTISQIEYSVDGNEWRPVTAADGILDQPNEVFSLRLGSLTPGPHVVTVRAFDSADNVGSARIIVQIPK
jgi:hypothetical protein